MQQALQVKKTERASNFELCRLACMFYIVVYHLLIHNLDVTGSLYCNRAVTTIFKIGVPVFVMISGYFKIKASVRGFLSIVTQVVFYSLLADILCYFVFKEPLCTSNIIATFFPVTKTQYWFVGTYLLLYILSPFINKFLDSVSRKEFCTYLVTISLLVCYGGGIMNVEGQNYGDRSILTFVFLYSIGRFVKVHENYVVEKAPKLVRNPWAIYSTLMFFFFVLVSFLPSFLPRGINFFAHAYNTIGLTLFSVIFLYCFKTLKIQKRWINAFAKSTFAIYLIHGNNIVTYHRWIYDPYTRYGITIDNMHLRLFYLLCSALAICFACIIID